MKPLQKLILVFFLFVAVPTFSQTINRTEYPELSKIDSTLSLEQLNSLKIEHIHNELNVYGKSQNIANKISAISIVAVLGGTLLGLPAAPLLVATSMCDLATLVISNRANKKLADKDE